MRCANKKLSCRRETARLCHLLKYSLGSLNVSENGAIRKLWYGFLFAFHSNYGRIFSRFDTINERDRHPATQPDTAGQQEPRAVLGCSCAAKIGGSKLQEQKSTIMRHLQESPTRGQSNLTKSASRGAHSPVRGHPRGSKVVPLNSLGRVSY